MKKKERNEIKTETYFIMIIALLLLLVCSFGCVHLGLFMNDYSYGPSETVSKGTSYTRSHINYLKDVELEDDEREIVYDGEERKTNRYPVINIASDEVDDLNRQIYHMQVAEVEKGNTLSYEFGVYEKYLIVNVIIEEDACNIKFANYIVDLEDYTVVTSETVLRELGLENSKVLIKAKNIVEEEYERTADKEDEVLKNASLGDIFNYRLSVLDNDLCLIVSIKNNETCSNTLRINLENYTYSYIGY